MTIKINGKLVESVKVFLMRLYSKRGWDLNKNGHQYYLQNITRVKKNIGTQVSVSGLEQATKDCLLTKMWRKLHQHTTVVVLYNIHTPDHSIHSGVCILYDKVHNNTTILTHKQLMNPVWWKVQNTFLKKSTRN